MQTFRAVVSLIARVLLLAIALPVLMGDFPGAMLPSRIMTDWAALTAVDAMAVMAPLMRWRKCSLLAGVAVLGAHFYFRHRAPVWDMLYLLIAIVFVLLPGSGRANVKGKGAGRLRTSRSS
ncbi:MAG TPA: hypothetical protein VHX60_03490 [Acidobacteriaceae bacterium]|nr:hypothetical protein [Acidobacteriaceae bacterium]